MINLFLGREDQDKDRFLFDRIARSLAEIRAADESRMVYLLVPDQYTLQAERNAVELLGEAGLIDVEVLSENRLADRILSQIGGRTRVRIDRLGRHMLLGHILAGIAPELAVYGGLTRSQAFIEMANDLISEFKQHGVTPEDVAAIAENLEKDTILSRKLADLARIFRHYEAAIAGKYADDEDFTDLFLSRLGRAEWVRRGEFWMTGYDYLSPKTRRLIEHLNRYSRGVCVILTGDPGASTDELLALSRRMEECLRNETAGLLTTRAIEGYERNPAAAIRRIERELFREALSSDAAEDRDAIATDSAPAAPKTDAMAQSASFSPITLCRAANFHSEAETAAAYITGLVRDGGLRYRDIAVVCNDLTDRGRSLRRVFEEYGIPYFMDQKRRMSHSPAVIFLFALLDIFNENWAPGDVFRLMKSGLTPLGQDECEQLENYALRYRIYGHRWRKPFRYGKTYYSEEELEAIERIRARLADYLEPVADAFAGAQTASERMQALRDFVEGEAGLSQRLSAMSEEMEAIGKAEAAQEIGQIGERLAEVMRQMEELAGEQTMSGAEFAEMLQMGVNALEVGLIPPTIDQIVVGTMQRTRTGSVKAVVLIGANDGVLPAEAGGDDILSRDERAFLADNKMAICKDNQTQVLEEQLALYRNLSRPTDYLYLSYSASDMEGRETRPSAVFHRLTKLFPDVPIERDILNRPEPLYRIQHPEETLRHLAEALRRMEGNQEDKHPEPCWQAAFNWYRERGDRRLEDILAGVGFDNRPPQLSRSLCDRLFRKETARDLTISPSRLELYSRCPFAHLVRYGLAPEERRVFELAGRERGDIYHECLRRLAVELTAVGVPITAESSRWMHLSRDDCLDRINRMIDEIAPDYAEGLGLSGKEEAYRVGRMKEVAGLAAWELVRHVQAGNIQSLYPEQPFGRVPAERRADAALTGAQAVAGQAVCDAIALPALEVATDRGKVRIEGIIDRLDILPDHYVKVIDYKSGSETFNEAETRSGWRLQLMLYLKAAVMGLSNSAEGVAVKPAGVFYFKIVEPRVDVTGIDPETASADAETVLRRKFRLDGVVVNHPDVIQNIAGAVSGYSDILSVRRNLSGDYSSSGRGLLSEEEFKELTETVDRLIFRLCRDLSDGRIDIRPKSTGQHTACDYCAYKSICHFEESFDGNTYDVVI